MKQLIKCGIAGMNGYVGQVLSQLIANHPNLALTAVLAKESSLISDFYYQGVSHYSLQQLAEQPDVIDILLLATPADVSIKLVQNLAHTNLTIIDLSGAFRLPINQLEHWYGLTHQLNDYQNGAPHGLSPYLQPLLGQTKLIANPGCYATGALLTLMPLLQNSIIDPDTIIIDAKSGVSGAGKRAKANLMFAEMTGNFMPYKVGQHQHLPEMKQCLSHLTGKACEMIFVTQLLPIKSGIAMSIYCQVSQQWINDDLIAKVVNEVFHQTYQDYRLLQFGQLNQGNSRQDSYLLSLNTVVGTPNIHISFHIEKGNLCMFACLDNLWKGAASQAIENINTLYQLPVDTGLQFYKGAI